MFQSILATSTRVYQLQNDRKPLLAGLGRRVFTIGLTRFAIVQADHQNNLLTQYDNDQNTLDEHYNAWFNVLPDDNPTWMPRFWSQGTHLDPDANSTSTSSNNPEDNDNDNDTTLRVPSPWPELRKKIIYGTLRDMSIIAVTWGLEELAMLYFNDQTCDRLTKNAYSSGKRKMERNDSKIATTVPFFCMHLNSSCLRWSAVFCVNTALAIYARVVAPKTVPAVAEGVTANDADTVVPVPLHYEIRKHLVNQGLSCLIESTAASGVVLCLPFKYGGTPHAYMYTVMSQGIFGLGGFFVRAPIVNYLFDR